MDPNAGKKHMFNKLSKQQALSLLNQENFKRITISFYKYVIIDSPEKIRKKIRSKAYLDPSDPHSPVYEILQYVIIPEYGEITVTPKPEYGEPTTYNSVDEFRKAVMEGTIHPLDAKFAVADALNMGLMELRTYFEKNPERLDEVTKLTG